MPRLLRLLGVAATLTAAPAFAQDAEAVLGNLRTFCSGDYLRLCAGMDRKGLKVVACFRRNMPEVSPGCRAAVAEYRTKAAKDPVPRP